MERRSEIDPGKWSRFWAKVDKSAGPERCWPWLGYRNKGGYGRHIVGWTSYAHRVAYWFAVGPFDLNLDVLHECDRPACCNPDHLWLGTSADNLQDASSKGRTSRLRGEKSSNHKLTWRKVREIRRRYAADGGPSQHALAAEYDVTQVAIHHIVTKVTWIE